MKIRITECTAYGDAFVNLTPESVHEVLRISQNEHGVRGFIVDSGTQWGSVLVLPSECNIVTEETI